MTTNSRRLFTIAFALSLFALVAGNVSAQYYATTAYYQPYTSYYAPAYSAGYAPVYTTNYAPAYTTYYGGGYTAAYAPTYTTAYAGGWYPGYWADRVRTRLWGSPTTYVAAYAPTYAAAYAPSTCSSCQAGYAAAYAPSTCSSCQAGYVTGYAPVSACSSCSTCAAPACSSCSTCTAGYAPAPSCPCASSCGCSSCETGSACSSCSTPTVTQASYQPQPSCGCSAGSTVQVTAPAQYVPPQQQTTQPLTPEPRPTVDPGQTQQAPPQTTFSQKPVETSQPQAPPATPPATRPEYEVKKTDNSTYLEAPKLFNPRDRTAQRSIAPVHTALYQQPAQYHQISTTTRTVVTAEQAEKDAAGWTSASK